MEEKIFEIDLKKGDSLDVSRKNNFVFDLQRFDDFGGGDGTKNNPYKLTADNDFVTYSEN